MMGSEMQTVLLRRQCGARSQSNAAGRARRKSGGEGGGGGAEKNANGGRGGSRWPGDTIYGTCWP